MELPDDVQPEAAVDMLFGRYGEAWLASAHSAITRKLSSRRTGNAAYDNGTRIARMLARHPDGLTGAQLSRKLGLPKSLREEALDLARMLGDVVPQVAQDAAGGTRIVRWHSPLHVEAVRQRIAEQG